MKKFIFLLLLSNYCLNAQVSLVPADHQVYEWLHHQRVLGNISYYSFETLPLSRGNINTLLKELSLKDSVLGVFDKLQLQFYINEFSIDSLRNSKKNTYIQGKTNGVKDFAIKKGKLLFSNEEPHLFTYGDSVGLGTFDYFFFYGTLNPTDDTTNYFSNFSGKAIRTYGTILNHIGYHVEISNPSLVYQTKALQYDHEWQATLDARKGKSKSTIYAEGITSVEYKKLSLHIGNSHLNYGVRGNQSSIFSLEGPNFDWVRINFDTKYFRYTFLHGSLQGPTKNVFLTDFDSVESRISPQRWIAMRRLQFQPFKKFTFAFTETLTYSNRPFDIAYANPIYPIRLSEYNTNDRDNPIWYIDAVVKPINGMEVYGNLGIDDLLKISDVFKKTGNRSSEDGVVHYQIGANVATRIGMDFNWEYVYFDPYFYTHWQRFNAYDQYGYLLGNQLGPNTSQWNFSVRQWFYQRGWLKLTYSQSKKGYNIYDEMGNLVWDAGGNIEEGQNGGDKVRFLSGELNTFTTYKAEGSIEPFRGIELYGMYSWLDAKRGNQQKDLRYYKVQLNVNFYPLNFLFDRIF